MTSASILAMGANFASAASTESSTAESATSNEALLKKLDQMEKHIQALEAQIKKDGGAAKTAAIPASPPTYSGNNASPSKLDTELPASTLQAPGDSYAKAGKKAILGVADSPVAGLSIGAYGELKFGTWQNPDANGQWQTGFDAARAVLTPTYALTNNIIFNSEFEFEHGGIAVDADDKLAGSIDVEQAYIDFKMKDWINWRAPGIDLVPIGYINEHHEPNQFYSVNRPELYLGLIPSTWRAPATRLYGNLGHGVSYDFQVSQSIEDFGDGFDKRTAGNAVDAVSYEGGFSGTEALALSRPPVGDFRQLSNTLAYAGRLEYQPEWLPGFAGSVSGYGTPNTTPRGAHVGDDGDPLARSSFMMFDTEFRYHVQNSGLELRGEFVRAWFGSPQNLRANNDGDPTNNVGKSMYGYSGEVAYHVSLGTILGSEWEAVPFYRYTFENLQTSGFAGTDDNEPTGAGRMQFHTTGVAVIPSPTVELKATYQKALSDQPGGPKSDYVLGGVGFQF